VEFHPLAQEVPCYVFNCMRITFETPASETYGWLKGFQAPGFAVARFLVLFLELVFLELDFFELDFFELVFVAEVFRSLSAWALLMSPPSTRAATHELESFFTERDMQARKPSLPTA